VISNSYAYLKSVLCPFLPKVQLALTRCFFLAGFFLGLSLALFVLGGAVALKLFLFGALGVEHKEPVDDLVLIGV
jgi:hypothetical protein